MRKQLIDQQSIKLVGLDVNTNNVNELNPDSSKIKALVDRYFSENVAARISNRKNPGVTFIVYTDYENKEKGNYVCYVGEEVTSFDEVPDDLSVKIIPGGKYVKFTTDVGTLPDIVINMWQHIWRLTPELLGGERAYKTDYEVYDQKVMDQNNAEVDIYIGIKYIGIK